MTTSNPSPAYVERVANAFNDNGLGERGDLGAVVKAILLDPEARQGAASNSNFGKAKEPLIRLSQLWRALDATPGASSNGVYRIYASPPSGIDETFGQSVLHSPTVFNFFLPTNPLSASTSSDLVSPEMQILTEANVAAIHNAFHDQIYQFNNQTTGGWDAVTRINIDKAVSLAEDTDQLIDYLDTLLLAGGLSSANRASIAAHINSMPSSAIDANKSKAIEAIYLLTASPEFMVQR